MDLSRFGVEVRERDKPTMYFSVVPRDNSRGDILKEEQPFAWYVIPTNQPVVSLRVYRDCVELSEVWVMVRLEREIGRVLNERIELEKPRVARCGELRQQSALLDSGTPVIVVTDDEELKRLLEERGLELRVTWVHPATTDGTRTFNIEVVADRK